MTPPDDCRDDDPFELGQQAYLENKDEKDNPYDINVDPVGAILWHDGYEYAEDNER